MALSPEERKEQQRQAGLSRWKNMSTTERSEYASNMAKIKSKKMTKEERSEHARKMVLARWGRYKQGK